MIEPASNRLKPKIIDMLFRRPMSLAELQSETGVSLPTLRRAVSKLTDSGWLTHVGLGTSTGGRPARLLGLNPETHLIIGTHVEIPSVNMVLTNLQGEILYQDQYVSPDDLAPDEAMNSIVRFTHKVFEKYSNRRLMGIGMAAPGYVDANTGTILYVGRSPGWENYPMKTRLEVNLNLPIIMENDTDCLIRAEMTRADIPNVKDMIYLGILEGVKVSMLLNGQMYSGPFGNAGLIGRSKFYPRKPHPSYGSYYDLEETTSIGGICKIFASRAELTSNDDIVAHHIHVMKNHNEKFKAILFAAENGHALCKEIIQEMIDDLSLAITNLIYILQPSLLVIGGALSNPPSGIKTCLESSIRDKLPLLLRNYLIIKYATMNGRYAAAVGSTYLFLQRFGLFENAFDHQEAFNNS